MDGGIGHSRPPGHNVLALDLATRTGWAEGHLGDSPRFGILHLDEATIAGRCVALEDWLYDRLEGPDPPKEVVFEAPLPRSADRAGINAGRLGMGLATMVEVVCFRKGVSCFESNSAEARKAVMGRGTFPKGEVKAAVYDWCISHGWDPPDDNAGDALVIWTHTLLIRRPGATLPAGPGKAGGLLVSARRHLGGSR